MQWQKENTKSEICCLICANSVISKSEAALRHARGYGSFWISTKTFHFSNHCAIVKTHNQHNLPMLPLKTMKSKFINQRITDIFGKILCRYLPCCVTSAYIIICLLCSIAAGWCESQANVSNFILMHSNPSSYFPNIESEIFEPNGQSHENTTALCSVGAGAFRTAEMDSARSRFSSRQEQKAPNYSKYLIDGPPHKGPGLES